MKPLKEQKDKFMKEYGGEFTPVSTVHSKKSPFDEENIDEEEEEVVDEEGNIVIETNEDDEDFNYVDHSYYHKVYNYFKEDQKNVKKSSIF